MTKRRNSIPEEELVDLLLKGEEEAMEIIYTNYSAAIYGVVFRLIQDKDTAEDTLQETFVKIWNNRSQYDASKGRLFTWMINIARHLAIDKRRSKDFRVGLKNQSLENIVNNTIEARPSDSTNPEVIGLKQLVDNLEPELKKIIDLLYFGGLTQEEASEQLGIPLGTVKTRSRNALILLRKKFNVSEKYK